MADRDPVVGTADTDPWYVVHVDPQIHRHRFCRQRQDGDGYRAVQGHRLGAVRDAELGDRQGDMVRVREHQRLVELDVDGRIVQIPHDVDCDVGIVRVELRRRKRRAEREGVRAVAHEPVGRRRERRRRAAGDLAADRVVGVLGAGARRGATADDHVELVHCR